MILKKYQLAGAQRSCNSTLTHLSFKAHFRKRSLFVFFSLRGPDCLRSKLCDHLVAPGAVKVYSLWISSLAPVLSLSCRSCSRRHTTTSCSRLFSSCPISAQGTCCHRCRAVPRRKAHVLDGLELPTRRLLRPEGGGREGLY